MNLNEKTKKRTVLIFKLAFNLKSRTNKAFKIQNVEKLNKNFDLVGCCQSFFKRWILHQLYGNMTEEDYGSVWNVNHCYPLSKTNLIDKNEMNKSTHWIKLRPMCCSESISKGSKIDNRFYLM